MSASPSRVAADGHTLDHHWTKLTGFCVADVVAGDGRDIDSILARLEKIPGVVLGPDRLVRLAVTLATLSGRGVRLVSGTEVGNVLVPLMTVNGEAQKAARESLEDLWPSTAQSAVTASRASERRHDELRVQRSRVILVIVALLVAVALAVILLPQGNSIPEVQHAPADPTEYTASSSTFWPWLENYFIVDLIHRIFAVTAVVAIGAVWWSNATRKRQEQLLRDRKDGKTAATMTAEVQEIVFPTAVLRRAGRLLRRPIKVAGSRIDIRRSIDASINADGYPVILTGFERRTPDCLLLVDRIGINDHLASLAAALAKRLRDGGADIYQYEFRGMPDVLEAVGRPIGGQPVLSLETLARRHLGARVIIISTGHGFFHRHSKSDLRLAKPFFGEPEEFPFVDHREASLKELHRPRVLPGFRDSPVLMTPSPPDRWGPMELALQEAGFSVISLGAAEDSDIGLESAVDVMIASRRSAAIDRNTVTRSTPGYDPLFEELDGVELTSNTPPPDPAYRARLARRVMSYACARIGEDEIERELPDDPYDLDNFVLTAEAGMAALALFPRLDPAFTAALWAKATGHVPSAARLARLARLPWFRYGRMPDWFRTDLAAHFREDARQFGQGSMWEDLRRDLAAFADDCLRRKPGESSLSVKRESDSLQQVLERLREARNEASPAKRFLVEEQLFIAFLDTGDIEAPEMAIDLPSLARPTTTMRLTITLVAAAAVLAGLVAPALLAMIMEWLKSILGSPNLGKVSSYFLMPWLCILLLVVSIFDAIVTTRIRISAHLLYNYIILVIISHLSLAIFFEFNASSTRKALEGLLYFPFPGVVLVLVFSFKDHLSRAIPISSSPLFIEVISYALIPAVVLVMPNRWEEEMFIGVSMPACLAAILLYLIARSARNSLSTSFVLSCCFYHVSVLLLFGWAFLRNSWSIEIPHKEVSAAVALLLFYVAFFPQGPTETKQQLFARCSTFLTFMIPSVAILLLVREGTPYPRYIVWAGLTVLGVAAAVTVPLPLVGQGARAAAFGFIGRVLTAVSAHRMAGPIGWLALVGKAGPVGMAIAAAAVAVAALVSAITSLFYAANGLDLAYLGPGLEALMFEGMTNVSTPTSNALAMLVACSAAVYFTFAATASPASSPVASQQQGFRALWWITPALWGIAVVPMSLTGWCETLGWIDPLRSFQQQAAPIVLPTGLVTWIIEGLFLRGAPYWPLLSYLALPLAVIFGMRKGTASNLPVFVGLLPFLLPLEYVSTRTPGGFWVVPLAFLLLRLLRSPSLLRLLRFGGGLGEAAPNIGTDIFLMLGLTALFTVGIVYQPWGAAALPLVDADPVRVVLLLIFGAMLLPPSAGLIALCGIAVLGIAGASLDLALADTGIHLTMGVTLADAIDMMVAFAAIPVARYSWRRPGSQNWILLALGIAILVFVQLAYEGPVLVLGHLHFGSTGLTLIVLSLTLGLVIAEYRLRNSLILLIAAMPVAGSVAKGFLLLTSGISLPLSFPGGFEIVPAAALVYLFGRLGSGLSRRLDATYHRIETIPAELELTLDPRLAK